MWLFSPLFTRLLIFNVCIMSPAAARLGSVCVMNGIHPSNQRCPHHAGMSQRQSGWCRAAPSSQTKSIFHVHFLYFHCAEDRLGPLAPCRKHCLPPLTGSVLVLLFPSTPSPSFLPSLALSLWFVFCDNSRDWSRHWMKKKNIICMKHSLIRPGVPLNCVVLHMVGLSGLILWILLIPCNLTNSLQFPPRPASPACPSSCCCQMNGNLQTLKCWTEGSGVSGVFLSNSALSKRET